MRKWTQEEDRTLRQMAASGSTQAQVAEALGFSVRQVRQRAWIIFVPFAHSNGGPKRRIDWTAVRDLAASGRSMSEASRILDIDPSTALHIGRRMGFKWPRTYKPTPPPRAPGPKMTSERLERMLQLAGRCAR